MNTKLRNFIFLAVTLGGIGVLGPLFNPAPAPSPALPFAARVEEEQESAKQVSDCVNNYYARVPVTSRYAQDRKTVEVTCAARLRWRQDSERQGIDPSQRIAIEIDRIRQREREAENLLREVLRMKRDKETVR
jgi:hypothetical protein